MTFINTSGYRFVAIPAARLATLKHALLAEATALDLKGTILLSTEGINCFLSGARAQIDAFLLFLETFEWFAGIRHKESPSDHQPFTRMLVRIKKEIIAMGVPSVQPEKNTAPHISPETLRDWYREQKDMVVLDTRNDYEYQQGTFHQAIDLNIDTFRDFPDAVLSLPSEIKKKPVVTFCTGGIRCEKAAQWMLDQGFEEVYQLDGGILNYFEQCGGEHWQGECFVFDKRVAVDSNLQETATQQCYACRGVIVPAQLGAPCSQCGSTQHCVAPTDTSSKAQHRREADAAC